MILRKVIRNAIRARTRRLRAPAATDAPPAALIFGVGAVDGIGAAVAQRAAAGGLHAYVCARSGERLQGVVEAIRAAGGEADAVVVDVADAEQVAAAFRRVADDGRAVELVVHNVGRAPRSAFADITPEMLEASWQANCWSGFVVGQQAVTAMASRERGTVIFTGASASMRGSAGFTPLATAKAGLRSLAQSMAREFGPAGLHIAHVVIDGAADAARAAEQPNQALDPNAIAETYWRLHAQHRSAWTHELDLRPAAERW